MPANSDEPDQRLETMMQGRCPDCSEPLFQVTPHQTTWRAIQEFLQSAAFDGAAIALEEEWLHPGSYCRKHGCVLTAEHPVPQFGDEHEYRVFLDSPGARRKEVILELKRRLGVSLSEGKALVDSPRPHLASGRIWQVTDLCGAFEGLGAQLEIEQRDPESGALKRELDGLPMDNIIATPTSSQPASPRFQPIVDDDGNVTGIMDEITAEYLASDAPDPSQHSLDTMLAQVTRVRVFDDGTDRGGRVGTRLLLETADPGSVDALRKCLAIVEDPTSFGHCMCLGDHATEFYRDQELLATIGLHHGISIRWEAWKHDAVLQNGQTLETWLAERGVSG